MVEAMQLLEEEFKRAGAWLETNDDGTLYPRFASRESELAAWKLVEVAFAAELAAESGQRTDADGATAVAAKVEPDLSGDPLPWRATLQALQLYATGESIRGVEREKVLKFKLARRVWTWHVSGAVRWDLRLRKPVFRPGYTFVQVGERIRLVRTDPA
jgi:hypothetical protein